MNLEQLLEALASEQDLYGVLDEAFLPLDREHIRRSNNIRLIPHKRFRQGGKHSYAEWAHVVGIFQTLLFLHLKGSEDNRVLDIGCGWGLMGIAAEPFIGAHGQYTGIDVEPSAIAFCRSHYPSGLFEFIEFDVSNALYAPDRVGEQAAWPVPADSYDMVTALSVWTHFHERDALFYLQEVARVLKPGGKAVISAFLLDDAYQQSVASRNSRPGRFHRLPQDRWVFDQTMEGSGNWYYPAWVDVPEQAIAINEQGLAQLLESANLRVLESHQGNWKEVPGLFFQDVLVLQKP